MAPFASLIQRQAVWRGGAPAAAGAPTAQTGYAALDAELPGGGWPVGGLAELLCRAEGVGELQIVLPALAGLTAAGHRIAWLAPPYLPYAPALRTAGVHLEALTVVRAPGRRDALWAAEQALRSGAFHGLLLWLPRASYPELRRLAVAAQAGPGFPLAFRPPGAGREASPAGPRPPLGPPGGRLGVRLPQPRRPPPAAPPFLFIQKP